MAQDVTLSLLSLRSGAAPRPQLIAGEVEGRRLPSIREDVPEGRVSWWLKWWLKNIFCCDLAFSSLFSDKSKGSKVEHVDFR